MNYAKIAPTVETVETARRFAYSGDHSTAVQYITSVIDICPWSSGFREMRAEYYIALNDHMNAISDIRSTTKLLADNTQGFFKLSTLLYSLGHVEQALK